MLIEVALFVRDSILIHGESVRVVCLEYII